MKRNKIIYDRWLRVLFLSFTLLVGGGERMAWGQTDDRPSIILQYDLSKHDSVFVDTKVIYVVPNRERVLYIPELRISLQTAHDRYNWYVHWYIKGKNGSAPQGRIAFKEFQTTKDEATNQGGDFIESSYTTENDFVKANCSDGGLVWSARLKEHFPDKVKRYGTDASTISYTMSNNSYTDGDTIYCDVSIYRDGNILGDNSFENAIYTEPTLTKRTKYIIKNAQECITKIENKEIEEFKFDYPAERTAVNFDGRQDNKNKSLNFSMPSLPNNYFWKKSDGTIVQGNQFEYKVVNGKTSDYKVFGLVTRPGNIIPFQQTQRLSLDDYPTEGEDIEVLVRATDQNGNKSGELAKFIFHPLQGVGFELEKNIKDKDERFPRRNKNKYRRIGWVNFDLGEPVKELSSKSSNDNNIATEPFGFFKDNHTTYGFFNKKVSPLLTKVTWDAIQEYVSTSNQNIYGLFRSANVEDKISENLNFIKEGDWYYRYTWIPATGSGNDKNQYTNTPLYDRTYHISQDPKDPINAGKEKNELTPQYGHFYYIDASNEPGTIVKIPIDGTICFNTEITVTAWLADMTRASLVDKTEVNRGKYPLAPNINIYLIGKNKDEEDVVIHRFTSGDALVDYSETTANSDYFDKDGTTKAKRNKNLMQWQQLYYSFVLQHNVEYENYYLEIQNNEPHTDGADYAIDDIRIFKTIPDIQVVQSGDPCDEKIKTVKFKSNYNMLLSNFGLTANTEIGENEIPLTYAEFEKLSEDHLLKKYLKNKYKTQKNIEDALKYFTTIYYAIYEVSDNTDAEGRPIPKSEPITIKYGNQESTYRTSYLSTRLEDMAWTTWSEESSSGTFKADDGYITSANVSINGELIANKTYIARVSETPIKGDDLECKTCSFYNSFVLEGVGDRIIVTKDDQSVDIKNIKPGESYNVTGTLKYNLPGSDELLPIEKPIFNWYLGTWDEFVKPGTITVGTESYSIMEAFKAAFHDMNNTSVSSAIENELKSKLGEYTDSKEGRLILNKTSFDFSLPTGKNMQWGIMLPRAKQNNIPENAVICPDPHEFLLGGTPPTIDPGDPDVPDPEDPDPDDPKDPDPKDPDDPNKPDENPFDGSHVRSVRVGLVQIQDMQQNSGTLRIPIHARTSLDDEEFAVDNTKTDIIVYKTSDKDWDLKPTSPKVVATLVELADDVKPMDWRKHYFKIEFTEQAKAFKEGFWYMVGIPYMVINKNTNAKKEYGDRVFMLTLKIVPEYVTWVGSAEGMHNWNNDGPSHWRRSNDGELYTTNIASANGTHDDAYTPMRFTKVTVANNGATPYFAYPYLYELKKNTGNQTKDPKNVLLNMAPASMDATIGAATKNIEYDLLADPDYEKELFKSEDEFTNPDKSQGHSYSCVRFYGNTCDDIYIKPESEILHTEYLTYNTAHVDYEMESNRWYMLASPLKGVVSGDMYLPTGTGSPKIGSYARQETPAFDKINYDNTNYTRWKPAVYMRGWDKTTATVVRPDGSTRVNYGIEGRWSNLYNDVDVPFTPGTGFSIGTKTAGSTTNKVLFRLPKADNEYTYYGSTNGNGDKTTLTAHRTGNGRFYISPDEKGQNAVTSCLVPFTGGMFGNPFMSHLNMKKFLDDKSQNTYYIMTSTGTTTNILGNEYSISTSDDADPNFVAPLQSFIVKDLPTATFTTAMIAKAPTTGKPGLRSATSSPADEPLPQLRITATRDGVRNTAVVAGLVTASDSYVEGEDAALLINEEVAAPQVYTLAGNQMTAINVTPELAEIPLGIYGKDATPVELSFKVSGAMKNVKLVDKQTGKRYDVTDGLTLTVPGNTSGRYVLNGSIATSNEIVARNRIIFYNSAPGRIDISSVDLLNEVTVYDVSGRALRTLRNLNTPTTSVDHLAPGIYVVRAESGSQVVSEKVEVK
ncbi:T9SS type A sorting domain-containing protein [Parabacteroides sp.]